MDLFMKCRVAISQISFSKLLMQFNSLSFNLLNLLSTICRLFDVISILTKLPAVLLIC